MKELLEKLEIDPSLQGKELVDALEKEKQKALRRLNAVFGNHIQEFRTQEILKEIEKAQNSLAELLENKKPNVNAGLVTEKAMSVDDAPFSPKNTSRPKLRYGVKVKPPSETSDLYRTVLQEAKRIISGPITPVDIVFSNFMGGTIDQQNEKIEKVTHAIVFGEDNSCSKAKLATWLLLKSIFQFIWFDAVEDEQNLFIVKEMLDKGVSGIISWDTEWRTDLDRFFALVQGQDSENIAFKNYMSYLKLASGNENNVVKMAQELFYYIGKLDNMFLNVPREKVDEASKNLAELICNTYSHKHDLDSDIIKTYTDELYKIIKDIASDKGSSPLNFFELLKAVKEREGGHLPAPDFKRYVESCLTLMLEFSTEVTDDPEVFCKYIEAGMPISGLTDEQLKMSIENFKAAHGHQIAEQTTSSNEETTVRDQDGFDDFVNEELSELIPDANAGDLDAQKTLASLYFFGSDAVKNTDEGLRWLKISSSQGFISASEFLAEIYFDGVENVDVAKDAHEGIKWLKIAAEQGSEAAASRVGALYFDGDQSIGVIQDMKEAVKWYKIAATISEDPTHQNLVGAIYLGEHDESIKDLDEARKWLKLAADQGLEDAQKWLERIEHNLQPQQATPSELEETATPQQESIVPIANQQESIMPIANGTTANTETEAPVESEIDKVIKGANAGNPESQFMLAMSYIQGTGIAPNAGEGLSWLKKAANQGVSDASEYLASIYFEGAEQLNIKRDVNEGIKWYKLAVEQGAVASAVKLGSLYSEGDRSAGILQDGDEAVKWYEKAATMSGDSELQNIVGMLYSGASGCTVDEKEAEKWLNLAAGGGNDNGQSNAKERENIESSPQPQKTTPEHTEPAPTLEQDSASETKPDVEYRNNAEKFEDLSSYVENLKSAEYPDAPYCYTLHDDGAYARFLSTYKYLITGENGDDIVAFFDWLDDGKDNSDLKVDEFPILLHDSTSRQNGKKGFVVTNKAIYTSKKRQHIKLEDVDKVKAGKNVIILNGSMAVDTRGDTNQLLKFLCEIIRYIKKYQAEQDMILAELGLRRMI